MLAITRGYNAYDLLCSNVLQPAAASFAAARASSPPSKAGNRQRGHLAYSAAPRIAALSGQTKNCAILCDCVAEQCIGQQFSLASCTSTIVDMSVDCSPRGPLQLRSSHLQTSLTSLESQLKVSRRCTIDVQTKVAHDIP